MATGTVDANGQVAKLFAAYGGDDVDVSKLDFESAVAVVLTNRTEALDQVLNGQLADMNQRNAQIKALNKFNELLRTSKDGAGVTDANKAAFDNSGGWNGVVNGGNGAWADLNGKRVLASKDDLYFKAKDLGIDASKYFEWVPNGNVSWDSGKTNFDTGYFKIKSGTVDGRDQKDGGVSFADSMKETIGDVIKDLTNEAQLDQIKLQSMMNKRGQVFELLSNMTSKLDSTRDKIVGNIR